jgi:hypothetical protein
MNDFKSIPDVVFKSDTALPHSLHSRCFLVSSFLSVRSDLLAPTSAWRFPFSIQVVRILVGENVIFYIPHFAEPLLRNIPYRYVVLEKSAGIKFGNKKKSQYGIYRPISCTACYYY